MLWQCSPCTLTISGTVSGTIADTTVASAVAVCGLSNISVGDLGSGLDQLCGWRLDGFGQGLLTLGEADNAACDALTLTFSVASLTVVSGSVFGLVEVILSLVDNHGAADNGVRSGKVNKEVSVLVLTSGFPSDLELLNITDTTVQDVLVRVTTVGTEWVEDSTSGRATVLEVTELVDFESVEAGLQAFEFTNDAGQIAWLLLELNTSRGVRVSEEVELAGGDDSLISLVALPVAVDGGHVVCLDVTGADG